MEFANNNVRNYTTQQLLDRVKKASGFTSIPAGYWFCFVRSSEDAPNVFDDKGYLFQGTKFIEVFGCTTNSGTTGLLNFQRFNRAGTFIAKTDQWNHDLWAYGLHQGRMPALRQVNNIIGHRDNNRNNKAEEIGPEVRGIYGINFHSVDYALKHGFWRRVINGWSVGCFVLPVVTTYLRILNTVKNQRRISMVLLKEFNP